MEHVLNDLRAFFVEYPSVGLVLPDGWFGRPYDTWLQFTRAEISGDELQIVFEQNETAILTGYFQIEVTGKSLASWGFSAAEWHWKAYGTNFWKKRHYVDGQLEFMGQPIGRDQ